MSKNICRRIFLMGVRFFDSLLSQPWKAYGDYEKFSVFCVFRGGYFGHHRAQSGSQAFKPGIVNNIGA
jgi:hypothetical protein